MTVFSTSDVGMRQHYSAQSIVDATGAMVITFTPPISMFWTGGVTVYDSADSVQWMVAINGITVDVVQGAATTSALQLGPGDILTLTTRTGTSGVTYHATLTVVATPENNTNLILPAHDPFHQPIEAVNLGTFTQGGAGPTPFNVPIPAGVNSIMVVGPMQLNDQLVLSDVATGTVYYNSNTELGGNFNPVWVNVIPNSTLHVAFTPASPPEPITIVGLTEASPVDNTSQTAVYTRDKYDGLAYTAANNTLSGSGTLAVVAAPPANNCWQICYLQVNAGTTALNLGASVAIRGASSGIILAGNYYQTTGIWITATPSKMFISEGLNLTNTGTTPCGCSIYYRAIPLWYL